MACLVHVPPKGDFPIQNLPFGVFRKATTASSQHSSEPPRLGVAIGDSVLDLAKLADAGCFQSCEAITDIHCFHQGSLNAFLSLGRPAWRQARAAIQAILTDQQGPLAQPALSANAVHSMSAVEMLLPATIGDFTDFYASKEHATNVGAMFRDKENALAPNWVHLPVAYHGRSSSVVPSGTAVRRPWGQVAPEQSSQQPDCRPSTVVDFELEMGFLVGPGNELGQPIDVKDAWEHVFGMVLLNDWSARDVQKWEYVPLGPFNSKNWATVISPWVVTLEALEPFRCSAPEQQPPVLQYLQESERFSYDVSLTASLQPAGDEKRSTVVAQSNLRHLYWTGAQMLAHHTIGGCNLRAGDLLGTGTISCADTKGRACLLEATSGGSTPIRLSTGEDRTFVQDGDTIELSGFCEGDGYRIGFGSCRSQLLPAHKLQ